MGGKEKVRQSSIVKTEEDCTGRTMGRMVGRTRTGKSVGSYFNLQQLIVIMYKKKPYHGRYILTEVG